MNLPEWSSQKVKPGLMMSSNEVACIMEYMWMSLLLQSNNKSNKNRNSNQYIWKLKQEKKNGNSNKYI